MCEGRGDRRRCRNAIEGRTQGRLLLLLKKMGVTESYSGDVTLVLLLLRGGLLLRRNLQLLEVSGQRGGRAKKSFVVDLRGRLRHNKVIDGVIRVQRGDVVLHDTILRVRLDVDVVIEDQGTMFVAALDAGGPRLGDVGLVVLLQDLGDEVKLVVGHNDTCDVSVREVGGGRGHCVRGRMVCKLVYTTSRKISITEHVNR